MKRAIVFLAMALAVSSSFAQTNPPKAAAHYVGVQANQLLRQILNFTNTSSSVTNPYLLTYSVNSTHSGWGGAIGLGYNYTQFSDGNETFTRTSTINDFFLRMGVEKKSNIAKNWMVSTGLDVIRDSQKDETKTVQKLGGSSEEFNTNTHTSAWGFGPRVALYYTASEKIVIGTESSYYFRSGKTVSSTDHIGTNPTHEENTQHSKRFQFVVPAVIFLVLKF
jgi:hypothetical protein